MKIDCIEFSSYSILVNVSGRINPITKGGGHIVPPLRFFAFNPNRRGLGVAKITDFSYI